MLSSVSGKYLENSAIHVAAIAALQGRVPQGVKDELWRSLGIRLSQLRSAAKLPATTVNSFAGVGKNTANAIEDGANCPRIDIVERFACVFDVSPSWIAFGSEGFEPFQQRRPRDVVPLDPPEPDPAERPATERYRGIGERCLRLRQARGLSLRPVAKAAGVSHESLNKIEKGVNVPLVSTCERLAVALDCAPCWLTYGEGQAPEGLDDSGAAAAD